MRTETPRGPPAFLRQTWEQATQDENPVVALAATRRLWEQWAQWQSVLVSEALGEGKTWDEIGQALGTSRQAAWARFRRLTDEENGEARQMQEQLAQVRGQMAQAVKALHQRIRQRDDDWRRERKRLQDQLRALDKQRAEDRKTIQAEVRQLQQQMRTTRHQMHAPRTEPHAPRTEPHGSSPT